MKMIDHIQSRLANGIQVHQMVMIGNQIVHCAHEQYAIEMAVSWTEPSGIAHLQRKNPLLIERCRHL